MKKSKSTICAITAALALGVAGCSDGSKPYNGRIGENVVNYTSGNWNYSGNLFSGDNHLEVQDYPQEGYVLTMIDVDRDGTPDRFRIKIMDDAKVGINELYKKILEEIKKKNSDF